jgi:peptidoglycan hydrolase-like protein with peptidoglycan-binding domain
MQGDLFAGTPFANSTPDAQRNIIAFAQDELASRGLYRDQIDGIFGPKLEFSLRAYQSRVGLAVTGRLDLATLAALELLPGAHTPVYTPRHPVRIRPDQGPPVRGEWVRP